MQVCVRAFVWRRTDTTRTTLKALSSRFFRVCACVGEERELVRYGNSRRGGLRGFVFFGKTTTRNEVEMRDKLLREKKKSTCANFPPENRWDRYRKK